MKLEDLGYNAFFGSEKDRLGLGEFSIARVTSEHKGAYTVKNESGEMLAKITGKHMFTAASREDYPAVGDWVAITELGNDQAVINAVLPRKSILKRTFGDKNKAGEKKDIQVIATNIDIAFVVESVDRDYNLNRFERYFSIARNGGVEPAIILNKIDLLSEDELAERSKELRKRFPNIDTVFTSTVTNKGLDELRAYIAKGRTYCFLGSSGVGKSSLINRLLETDAIRTGDISSYSDRGKHVTTERQLYVLKSGGIVIDNPGVREVGMTDTNQGIDASFDAIASLAQTCRYPDCSHMHEPGCAVLEAVETDIIDAAQYENYLALKSEAAYHEMDDTDRKEKDKKLAKFIKTAKKDFKRYKPKNY
jgi:ribosome biogenesis GTPase